MSRLIAFVSCCSVMIVAVGCGDLNPNNAKPRNVANPPGIAPAGMDPMNANQAPANPQPAPQQPVAQQPAQPEAPAKDGKGIIGKETDEIVDYHETIKNNPNFEIIENKAKGDDLLSFY